MKWINLTAAADNYPTDGKGARSATAADSGFASGKPWHDKTCVLIGMVVNPGTAATTITITGHDGTVTPVAAVKGAANASSGTYVAPRRPTKPSRKRASSTDVAQQTVWGEGDDRCVVRPRDMNHV